MIDRLRGESFRILLRHPRWAWRVLRTEGQITPAEAWRLTELAGGVSEGEVVVEVGSYRGRSAVALAAGLRPGSKIRIFAVDPHDEFRGLRGGVFGPPDQAALYRNLSRAGVGEAVAVVSLRSTEAAAGWPSPNIGLLWLDGDHSYEAVTGDFAAWRRHLAPGAVVAFHDSDTEDVARVLDELEERGDLVRRGRVASLTWCTVATGEAA
jgi:predicted O-methyltransferase YrrM